MNEKEGILSEIEKSDRPIELDISPDAAVFLIDFLRDFQGYTHGRISVKDFTTLQSQLILALDFAYPGSRDTLYSYIDIEIPKYEEL